MLVASLIFTPLLGYLLLKLQIIIFNKFGWVISPNSHSTHNYKVVSGGGLVLCSLWLVIYCSFFSLSPLIIIISILALISFIDDYKPLPIYLRLLAHLVAITYLLNQFEISYFEQLIITLAWIWLINLSNFMDGIDGITASNFLSAITPFVFFGIFEGDFAKILVEPTGFLFAVISLSLVGFLFLNYPPAKIFLGDSGSIALGFLMGYIGIISYEKNMLIQFIIVNSYYLADSGFTLVKRFINKEKFWQGHNKHIYQQAYKSGLSAVKICVSIIVNNLICVFAAVLLSNYFYVAILLAIFSNFALFLFLKRKITTN